MIRTTRAQRAEIQRKLTPEIRWQNEKIWTYLVADLIDQAPDQGLLLSALCGEAVPCTQRLDLWFEAEPLSPGRAHPE